MLTADYTILTLPPEPILSLREGFAGSAEQAFEQARMETAGLTPQEAAQLASSEEYVIAEHLPITLIEPIASAVCEVPAAPGSTWGLEVTGVGGCPLTGEGITVAVLDTGIDAVHPAFVDIEVVEEDFTGAGGGDPNGHGTHCAGTIAGAEVNGYRFGIAPGVERLLAGKVLGPGASSGSLARAIPWACENGADVISMSLGIDFPGAVANWVARGMPLQAATSQALRSYVENVRLFDALAAIVSNPLTSTGAGLLIAAAGNHSRRDAAVPYVLDCEPPAAAKDYLAIAALDQGSGGELTVAPFSNTGVVAAAPGVGILSAWPGGSYAELSGTSMAAPHVAGLAALWGQKLFEADGVLDPTMLQTRLLASAVRPTGLVRSDVGAGLVHAPTA
ncbi:MAG: S8 family serine peptidase [Solirubrobacteraceae bacterium]